MLKENSRKQTEQFLASVRAEYDAFAAGLSADSYEDAAGIIIASQAAGGRIHVTGIGKCSHVATYAASLLSSTGNPAYYLHGTEAVHGSCGQLCAGDTVIAISNSGETAELKATVIAVKNNGCKVIGVTGGADSWLAKNSDALLPAKVGEEGGPLNRAPRNSVLAEMFVLQALSAILQADCGQTPAQYVRCHPGGKLGELRKEEK